MLRWAKFAGPAVVIVVVIVFWMRFAPDYFRAAASATHDAPTAAAESAPASPVCAAIPEWSQELDRPLLSERRVPTRQAETVQASALNEPAVSEPELPQRSTYFIALQNAAGGDQEGPPLTPAAGVPPPLAPLSEPLQTRGDEDSELTSVKPGDPQTAWPRTTSLFDLLDRLALQEPSTAEWCTAVNEQLKALQESDSLTAPAAATAVKNLRLLLETGKTLAAKQATEMNRSRILRVVFAMNRRVSLYEATLVWAARSPLEAVTYPTREEWEAVLASVNTPLQQHPIGTTWSKYLALSELRMLSSTTWTDANRRSLAREVLRRMYSTQLTDTQLLFLQQPPFNQLSHGLMRWAHEPLNVNELLAVVERFEQQELATTAAAVAQQFEIARWSFDPTEQAIADQINVHYRNANVRIAVTGEFLNRLMPGLRRMTEPVVDEVQGAYVEGQSETLAQVRLVLIPDKCRWRLGLEATGEVATSTLSSKGPATFWQDGKANFVARKLLVVDRRNIRLFGAEADADAQNFLRDFETDYDNIPLIGSIARSIARQQYEDATPAAREEVSGKVAVKAEQKLNEAVDQRVSKARNELKVKLLSPLKVLDLDPTAIDMETTAERVIARYRLAGAGQLAANTPRPQAPTDSLLSIQVHQSSLNNALQQLRLEGQQIDLRALYSELTELFLQRRIDPPEDIPENVRVTFFDEDALRVDSDRGKIRVTIRLKELAHADDAPWKNFTVRAYYVPDPEQKNANLVRDGVIELSGDRLRLGDQVALRGIFSKVLSRNRSINLINKQLATLKETADLKVTQFAIQDGWIGIALGKGPGLPTTPNGPLLPPAGGESEKLDPPMVQPAPTTPVRATARDVRATATDSR